MWGATRHTARRAPAFVDNNACFEVRCGIESAHSFEWEHSRAQSVRGAEHFFEAREVWVEHVAAEADT